MKKIIAAILILASVCVGLSISKKTVHSCGKGARRAKKKAAKFVRTLAKNVSF
jgi:hypothetical protein